MADNIVTMTKKGKEVKVVKSAYDRVWKDRGWTLKGDAPKQPVKKTTESATP